jgi:hypothetical protein
VHVECLGDTLRLRVRGVEVLLTESRRRRTEAGKAVAARLVREGPRDTS